MVELSPGMYVDRIHRVLIISGKRKDFSEINWPLNSKNLALHLLASIRREKKAKGQLC